jgi:hypothetical protein
MFLLLLLLLDETNTIKCPYLKASFFSTQMKLKIFKKN